MVVDAGGATPTRRPSAYLAAAAADTFEEAGLVDVEEETTTWKCRGGGQAARFQQMNLQLVQTTLPSFVPRDDYERHSSLYEDPSFAFVFMAMVGAWGRRPQSTP